MDSKHHTDRDLSKTSPSQLALLMGLDETQSLWSEDDNAAMIHHLLDSPIPDNSNSSATASTFGRVLAAHNPDVDQLRRVKEFAKSCRTNPKSGLPEDIATVLYYAAVAAARLRCGHAISQLSVVELRDGINWALTRNWLPDQLKDLFQAASRKLSARPRE